MALHHVRLVPAVSIGQLVETGFTNQPGVQPVQLRQAAAVERTSWEVRTRGQLDSRCLSVGFNQLNFGADEVWHPADGFEASSNCLESKTWYERGNI